VSEIVVGVDGSASSRAALRWAARVAAAKGATVRVVASWQYPAAAGSPGGPAELLGPAEMDRRTTEDLRAIIGEEIEPGAGRVQIEVGRGPAAGVLLASAARSSVDMLVLGARGLGGFDGLLLGSVTQQCVEHSPCPVVVLRGDEPRMDGPIVVGMDDSEGSRRALDWVMELADATGAELVVVHATGGGVSDAVLDRAGRTLDGWCAPIRDRGIAHQPRIEAAEPRTALQRVANETDAALLVVGARGLGAVQGLLLSSVAGYVVRYARRSIAVVPGRRRP
jgi:nucleotide-binding universal stress UspA family protein